MESLTLLGSVAKNRQLDMAKYRRIMSLPTFHYLCYAVISTRSYEEGLEAALFLLHFTEEHRPRLGSEQYRFNTVLLYHLLLTMLDKMDRWEEYLEVWESIRQRAHQELLTYRKEVIERKVARKRAGRKLGNMMHARREELSEKEVQRRLKEVIRWARCSAGPPYVWQELFRPDPSASRTRAYFPLFANE